MMFAVRIAAVLATAALGLSLAPHAQAQTAAEVALKAKYKAPRNGFGQPDLNGVWTNATLTPVQREAKYGERLVISAEEAAAIEKATSSAADTANAPTDPNAKVTDLPHDCGGGFTGVNCGYNSFWIDAGTSLLTINGEKRTSIYTTPNGRSPGLKPEAAKRMREMFAGYRSGSMGNADGPEVRSLGERCLMSFGSSAGPPMLPLLYNNNYQIVQTPDAVMIEVEMVHDVRVVRLNAKHDAANIKRWMGDSIGWWDGDTLVIETINLRPEQNYRLTSDSYKVTERLTRVAPNQILYSFTVEDETYTGPLTGELMFTATKGPLYEYACHEGNHALPGILRGARMEEADAKKAAEAPKAAAG
ncbi:MAG TPA: hypothetical protein VIO94_01090, partial [Phenylobacterium sp.]